MVKIDIFGHIYFLKKIFFQGSEMSYKIVAETVKTKMSSWLQIHLPPGYCVKDFFTAMQKYSKDKQKVSVICYRLIIRI